MPTNTPTPTATPTPAGSPIPTPTGTPTPIHETSFDLSVVSDHTYDIVLTSDNLTVMPAVFRLTYNPSQLILLHPIDPGIIPGTDITILAHSPSIGNLTFQLNTELPAGSSYSRVLTVARFQAKTTGATSINLSTLQPPTLSFSPDTVVINDEHPSAIINVEGTAVGRAAFQHRMPFGVFVDFDAEDRVVIITANRSMIREPINDEFIVIIDLQDISAEFRVRVNITPQ